MANLKDDIIKLCCEISTNKRIKAAFKNSAKGAVVTGGTAFVGGLLGGPAGIAVGAVVGGALGGWMTSGQFKPLPEILMELSHTQQEKLYSDVMAIVGTLKWTEVAQLIAQVNGNASLHEQVLGAVLNFTKNQLKADVRYED
ncbi:protein C19orf12 homolog [Sinocyclocheilus grahami]|uniref:Protein C19orf12 homolog n=1 Tax=Sinocyclocheilus grahami TaxID=75366 RepID=A0A672MT29_SINGR|nr:PREDICTED: protein C19orf12 homolog [Sinocyclocheilus grahami]XP_016102658.1 PREDICTED: protein C19orf12 homolog [Sinocyclocheilus grahami]